MAAAALYHEAPNGGGVMFLLTPAGRLVWDGERGAIARAELVLQLERRGEQLAPAWKRARGVPGPTVIYGAGYVGVPAFIKRARLLREERARPIYCRTPGALALLERK